MPLNNDKVPRYLSLECPNCSKSLNSNQVYIKTRKIDNFKMEKK